MMEEGQEHEVVLFRNASSGRPKLRGLQVILVYGVLHSKNCVECMYVCTYVTWLNVQSQASGP